MKLALLAISLFAFFAQVTLGVIGLTYVLGRIAKPQIAVARAPNLADQFFGIQGGEVWVDTTTSPATVKISDVVVQWRTVGYADPEVFVRGPLFEASQARLRRVLRREPTLDEIVRDVALNVQQAGN